VAFLGEFSRDDVNEIEDLCYCLRTRDRCFVLGWSPRDGRGGLGGASLCDVGKLQFD